jgi:hypothetical protein
VAYNSAVAAPVVISAAKATFWLGGAILLAYLATA